MNKIQMALLATALVGASVTVRAEDTSATTMTEQSTVSATSQEMQSADLQETREVASQFIDDSVVTARVVNALLAAPEVAGVNLNVETLDGVVSLSGSAASDKERQEVVQAVSAIDGVCDVQDNIQTQR